MHANLDVYGFDLNPNDVQKAIDNFPQFDEKSDRKVAVLDVLMPQNFLLPMRLLIT